jgi:hypothetical protein
MISIVCFCALIIAHLSCVAFASFDLSGIRSASLNDALGHASSLEQQSTSSAKQIDISLYSRQVMVHGLLTQEKLQNANVLVVGNGVIADEVVKNLALMGIGTFTFLPEEESANRKHMHIEASGEGFLRPRNMSLRKFVVSLNPRCKVIHSDRPLVIF